MLFIINHASRNPTSPSSTEERVLSVVGPQQTKEFSPSSLEIRSQFVCVFTLPYYRKRNVSTSAARHIPQLSRLAVGRWASMRHHVMARGGGTSARLARSYILPEEKCEYVIRASPPTTITFLAAHRKFMCFFPFQLCECVA